MEERRLLAVAPLATALTSTADAATRAIEQSFPGTADRVSSLLLSSYFRGPGTSQLSTAAAQAMADGSGGDDIPLLTDPLGRVGVVVTAVDPEALARSLASLGMEVAAALPSYHRVEGFLPLTSLPAVSNLGGAGLLGIEAVPMPKTFTGTVESQADNILEADRVRASTPGYSGAGVKIGVLSDSYDKSSLVTHAAASISSGNLPNNVAVLQDFNSSGFSSSVADEGRAMLELIYDLAPGASLGFATADISEAQFAANIKNLASAGYTIINDDVFYYDEPYFQDGIVAQAVDTVVTGSNVAYYSAAGNEGNLAYDSAATAAYGANPLSFASQTISAISASASSYYDWDPSGNTDTLMSITIPRGQTVYLDFQWDQPYYTTSGVTTNLDFYLLSVNATSGAMTSRASVTTNNVTNQTPFSLLTYTNNLSGANATSSFNLVIRNTNGGPVPGRIKFIDDYGSATVVYNEYFTHSATVVGHAAAANAQAVGAAAFYEQTTPEDFSSVGPATILFNTDGTRKATAEVRAKPDILSIDGADTSFFYPGDDVDGNGLNNFFGTSAATPHAAAVAALLKQANPSWTPSQINARLKATADPSVGNGDPNVIGAGLIDAYRAIFGGPVAASPLVADGFESGALGGDWQVYKSGAGLVQVTTTGSPATGADQLVLGGNIGYGTTGFNLSELSEATLHLNLAGQTGVVLGFSEKKFSTEVDDAMPASFNGHGNYDGVALSVDGVHWYRVASLTGANSTAAYQPLSFNLSAIAASLGLTLGSDTQVKFQQYNAASYVIGYRGIALDNIQVSAQSSVASVAIDNGTAQRSSVRSLTVDFKGKIVSAPASAFSLVRTTDGVVIPVTVASTTPIAGGTRLVLGFGGTTLEGGSLADGRYTLSINGGLLLDDAGRAVDADGNGSDGGTRTVDFFRFFGDSNGDAVVDGTDYLAFLAAYRTGVATGAAAIFDSNGDGVFTAADLNAFMLRFNKRKLP